MNKSKTINMSRVILAACLLVCLVNFSLISAERDRDNDDFDDGGFDDSGYSSPQNHEAEGSHQSPSNYQGADDDSLDDDDDVDESNNILAKVSSPRQFFSSANSIVVPIPVRPKRSVDQKMAPPEGDIEDSVARDPNQPLIRKRRHYKKKKYIGPVYTYVKTDKHAHYKWGVKHKVGKHYG